MADRWVVWQGPKGRHVEGPDFPWMQRTPLIAAAEVERLREERDEARRLAEAWRARHDEMEREVNRLASAALSDTDARPGRGRNA